ncbi:hypothetical protein [Segetibacter aerophilus]|uniref:Uncharacterized protein n=1 Tax=Segetibacter aerophilus TaxID=670293 RepID=A0A512B946_9BACT|nr:hypothetical protein [Segetibacter aerophilus]GEO08494.1 hypothetical protein SAE01_09900 [Segetibacter aerophilus]
MKMITAILITIVFVVISFYTVMYVALIISSYIENGERKYRSRTTHMEESKELGVFVKELNFKVDSFSGKLYNFHPYIEKGYKYGKFLSTGIKPLTNSKFPYQFGFNEVPQRSISIAMRKEELEKFDSANNSTGYLKLPQLPDTITLNITLYPHDHGIIKVW